MLPPDAQIVSVDDHVIEHPNVWTDRLPKKYQEAGPRIEHRPDGSDVWIYEGELAGNLALNAVAGKDPRSSASTRRASTTCARVATTSDDRIRDMDLDGVQAQLCFPTFAGFAGSDVLRRRRTRSSPPRASRRYNDFIIDEWCAAYPGRQIPLVMLPYWDVDADHRRGRSGSRRRAPRRCPSPRTPAPLGLPSWHSDHWDPSSPPPQDADLPLCLHFGSRAAPRHVAPEANRSPSRSPCSA